MEKLNIPNDTYLEEGLLLIKGGYLIDTKWVPPKRSSEEEEGSEENSGTEKGYYKSKDVTDHAVRFLFEKCRLSEDYTVKDFFLFLNTDVQMFDSIFGNWLKDLTEEALKGIPTAKEDSSFVDDIDYLELYFGLETNCFGDEEDFYGLGFPNFHGMGTIKPGSNQIQPPHCNVGDITPFGIEFTATYELIDKPLKLSREVVFSIMRKTKSGNPKYVHKNHTFKNPSYTLGQIINGIVWEWSFSGGPESRQEFKYRLDSAHDEFEQNHK
jgi:hypothetical protein